MRSRHMLRPLGDSAYTRLLINSQAFVLADNTGEITPGTFSDASLRHRLLDTINRADIGRISSLFFFTIRAKIDFGQKFTIRGSMILANSLNSRKSKGEKISKIYWEYRLF